MKMSKSLIPLWIAGSSVWLRAQGLVQASVWYLGPLPSDSPTLCMVQSDPPGTCAGSWWVHHTWPAITLWISLIPTSLLAGLPTLSAHSQRQETPHGQLLPMAWASFLAALWTAAEVTSVVLLSWITVLCGLSLMYLRLFHESPGNFISFLCGKVNHFLWVL